VSLINSIKEPGDLLKKLIRDGNLINFEEDPEKLSDLIFNFSVTCHSLRDWCIKYQGKESVQEQLNTAWNEEKSLQAAKDIANSTKHFGITRYTPTVDTADASTAQSVEFRSNQNVPELMERVKSDQELSTSLETTVPSYQIKFVDGDVLALWEFVSKAIRCWLSYFDSNGIPRDMKLSQSLIYIHQSEWENLA